MQVLCYDVSTAPLIFRGQIGLALEKAAKPNFRLEDVYNSSNKAIMEFLFFFSLSSIVSRLAYQCFYLGRTLLGCILPSVCFHLGSADIWLSPQSRRDMGIWTTLGAQVQTRLVVFTENLSMEKVFRSIHMCFWTLWNSFCDPLDFNLGLGTLFKIQIAIL